MSNDARPNLLLVILAVADLDRAVRFYRAAFGWSATVEVPVYVQLALPDGRGIGLYERESFGVNTGVVPQLPAEGQIGGAELYLGVADLDVACTRILAAGGRALSAAAPRLWGDTVAYFADPDGHVIALADSGEHGE